MKNAIEIRGLCKSFGDFALDHIDLTLPGGSIMGLIGENGAGKTTTIKCILNLIRRDAGEISIWDRDNLREERAAKAGVGVVLDECFFHDSLRPRDLDRVLGPVFPDWDRGLYGDYLDKFRLPANKLIREFSRGARRRDPAPLHEKHPIGSGRFVEIRRGDEGVHAVPRGALFENAPEFAARKRIHADRRLVENEKLRAAEKRCGQSELLLHAARKLPGEPILEAGQSRERHELPKAGRGFLLVESSKFGEEAKVFRHAQVFVEAEALRHEADLGKKGGVFGIGNAAADFHDALVGLEQSGGEFEERRLAGPVGTDHRRHAGHVRDAGVDGIDRREAFARRRAEALRCACKAKNVLRHGARVGNSTVTGCPRRSRFSGSGTMSFTS